MLQTSLEIQRKVFYSSWWNGGKLCELPTDWVCWPLSVFRLRVSRDMKNYFRCTYGEERLGNSNLLSEVSLSIFYLLHGASFFLRS
jgi:hypothetical protein